MKKGTVGILGIGEIGKAISDIFAAKYKVYTKDLNFDYIGSEKLKVLHVCIPYNKSFVKNVTRQIKLNKPELTIIHSTVKPGTTQNIFLKTKVPIVHSPVMGKHPNLKSDILLFRKLLGPANIKSSNLALVHLKTVGIRCIVLGSSSESEVGKLLDTSYYAWNILFNKFSRILCDDLGLNFENVYTKFNEVYNEGYTKNLPNVRRPVLKYKKGPIGGHCVMENAEILNSTHNSDFIKFLIKFGKKNI